MVEPESCRQEPGVPPVTQYQSAPALSTTSAPWLYVRLIDGGGPLALRPSCAVIIVPVIVDPIGPENDPPDPLLVLSAMPRTPVVPAAVAVPTTPIVPVPATPNQFGFEAVIAALFCEDVDAAMADPDTDVAATPDPVVASAVTAGSPVKFPEAAAAGPAVATVAIPPASAPTATTPALRNAWRLEMDDAGCSGDPLQALAFGAAVGRSSCNSARN